MVPGAALCRTRRRSNFGRPPGVTSGAPASLLAGPPPGVASGAPASLLAVVETVLVVASPPLPPLPPVVLVESVESMDLDDSMGGGGGGIDDDDEDDMGCEGLITDGASFSSLPPLSLPSVELVEITDLDDSMFDDNRGPTCASLGSPVPPD